MAQPRPSLEVAIIGGGIIGVTLGLGLLRRGVSFTIYERASSFREIGAGIAFPPNAVRAMESLDPRIVDGFHKVVSRVLGSVDSYVSYVDGTCEPETSCEVDDNCITDKEIFRRYLGGGFGEGCRRSDFLEATVQHIPSENVRFQKNLLSFDKTGAGRELLKFEDGSSTEVDVVIGCDGIKSRVRSLMYGETHPASRPGYTHYSCYRAVIPMNSVSAAVGEHYRVPARTLHSGPDAHLVTYPISGGKMLNLAAVVYDPNPWMSSKLIVPATREELIEAFAAFGPTVRAILSTLPKCLDKWGIFDLLDNPVPEYSKGTTCLAGDAAHASSPFHGAGAGLGIEDSLVLAELLAAVDRSVQEAETELPLRERIEAALTVYNDVRYERTQWLMDSSRRTGELWEWRFDGIGGDFTKFEQEEAWRVRKIRDFDTEMMVQESLSLLRDRWQSSQDTCRSVGVSQS